MLIRLSMILGIAGVLAASGPAFAVPPVIRSIQVEPADVVLRGLRDQQQLLVSAQLSTAAAAETADVTRDATYESLTPTIALVSPQGLVIPRGHGKAELLVKVGSHEQKVAVRVEGIGEGEVVDFKTDVIAALSRAGCNQGACHGSPQGKGGFRLSLRGFDPVLDYDTLARESFGRRTNRTHADASLILQKALGEVPHQGGIRFKTSDPEYQTIRTWIHQGCKPSFSNARLVKLEALPSRRRLPEVRPQQQLIARAHFDDGTVRDVTHLAVFSSNNEDAATVSRYGVVEFHGTSEASLLVRYLDKFASARLSYVRRDPEYAFQGPVPANAVDEHVFARQRELQVQPAAVADDAMFLRRVYLDVIGTLPTPDEARQFLDSKEPAKRSQLVDELLQRPEFSQFWALKWADVLRGSDVTISKRGVFSFHRYLVDLFRKDRPFNEFAHETLTGQGNTLYSPPANFFRVARTPDEMAEAMAQLFLGVRINCAKCHNHPFESITQNDYYGFAAYFARVKFKGTQFGLDDEIVYLDRRNEVRHPLTNQVVPPAAFGLLAYEPPAPGKPSNEPADADRREKLAAWLIATENPYFSRAIVNRVWYHLFGKGVVEPVDDFRDTNPPSNPELLDALAADFVKNGYRLKPTLRQILNSRTYQLSSIAPAKQSRFSANPDRYFAVSQVRMLTGEQILDAISQATGNPTKFDGYPLGTRAIEVAEGTIEHPFLQAFSKPVRDAVCECARDGDPSISQVIHLLNNPEILSGLAVEGSRIDGLLKAGRSDDEAIETLYLATLSRRPTAAEKEVVNKYLAAAENRKAGLSDLLHALMNANEFLLRH